MFQGYVGVFLDLRPLLDILPATGVNPQLGDCARIGFPGASAVGVCICWCFQV